VLALAPPYLLPSLLHTYSGKGGQREAWRRRRGTTTTTSSHTTYLRLLLTLPCLSLSPPPVLECLPPGGRGRACLTSGQVWLVVNAGAPLPSLPLPSLPPYSGALPLPSLPQQREGSGSCG
jgi:hypothetical protein